MAVAEVIVHGTLLVISLVVIVGTAYIQRRQQRQGRRATPVPHETLINRMRTEDRRRNEDALQHTHDNAEKERTEQEKHWEIMTDQYDSWNRKKHAFIDKFEKP